MNMIHATLPWSGIVNADMLWGKEALEALVKDHDIIRVANGGGDA